MSSPEHPVNYTVTAIYFGSLNVDWTAQLYGREPGVMIDSPVWGAVIEGNGLRALVDTGVRDPAMVSQNMAPCTQAPGETPAGALDVLGWRPGDIDVVINTHLHFDHCGHNAQFPNARFYVSQAEWDFAQQSDSPQANLYAPREWLLPPLSPDRYVMVGADDYTVADGLEIFATPGHSPGHQSVLVRTTEGTLCIAGDAVNIPENFTLRRPVGYLTSLEQGTRSIEVIRGKADRLLMAHDNRLVKFMTSGYPEVPGPGEATVCTC